MAKITIEELSGSLKEYLNGLGLTEAQVQELIDKFEDEKIGDISQLSTENKTNIVAAINELFQSANNGKELIASAIGEPLSSEDTFSAMSSDINGLLATFKTNMMNNGVTVESGDKFKALIDKIATMVEEGEGKGIQFAEGSGSFTPGSSYSKVTVTNDFGFVPTLIVVSILGYISTDNKCKKFSFNSINNYSSDTACEVPGLVGKGGMNGYYISDISNTSFGIYSSSSLNDSYKKIHEFTWYAIGVGEEDTTLRDSLASILQEEGVSVTEEDDMASLISKVDEEFDKQVVPAGDAVAANVDKGKTFINSTGQVITGTSNKVSPAGTAVASNVLSGKTFINSTGQTITGTMANRGGAQTITPGTSNKTLNSGYYSGNITVQGDNNLIAANIVSGKSIFGVSGTASTVSVGSSSSSSNVAIYCDLFYDYSPDEDDEYVTILDGYSSPISGSITIKGIFMISSPSFSCDATMRVYVNGRLKGNNTIEVYETDNEFQLAEYTCTVNKGDTIDVKFARTWSNVNSLYVVCHGIVIFADISF